MVEINNLSIKDLTTNRFLVENLSCFIRSGEHLAIIGEEGNGKTTLLYALAGLTRLGIEITGNMCGYQHPMMLFQDVRALFGSLSPEEFLLDDCSLPITSQLKKEIPAILARVGLTKEILAKISRLELLSGGEAVRLSLAKILLHQPDFVLLDEPTNDLDQVTRELIKEYILHCSVPLIFVSHDEQLLNECADAIIHLRLEKRKNFAITIYSRLSYDQYLNNWNHQRQKDREIGENERRNYRLKQTKYQQIYQKVAYAQNQAVRNPGVGRLLKKKMHSIKSLGRRMEKEKDNFHDIPEEDPYINLTFPHPYPINRRYRLLQMQGNIIAGFKLLITDVNVLLHGGDHILLTGLNGVGKTTLLRYIKGQAEKAGLKVGYMPQNFVDLKVEQITPVDFLSPSTRKEDLTKTRQLLGRVYFTPEEMLQPIGQLSGGEKSKLLFLKVFISDTFDLVLLDEPTRNISPLSQASIRKLIADFPGTLIIATHDQKLMEELHSFTHWQLVDGKLIIED